MPIKQYNYDKFAKYYHAMDLANVDYEKTNRFLDKIFKKYKVKTILDMTCGTGAQSINLAKKGYKVTASDISKGMLKIAKKKAQDLRIKFYHGDIRTAKYGKFDAVIAMFNAIGHLTKKEFKKAIRNVGENLKPNSLFIFDIFNFKFMKANFRDYEFIDVAREREGIKYVRFNNNRFDSKKGIMKIDQTSYIQKGGSKPEIHREIWDMQIYTADELKNLLEKNGFKIAKLYDGNGKKFIENKSMSIFVVTKKK